MEKRKPERRDRTAAPRPAATPPAIRHRTATRPFRTEKMKLRRSKCTTYDNVAFNLPIVAFTLSGDPFENKKAGVSPSAKPSPKGALAGYPPLAGVRDP